MKALLVIILKWIWEFVSKFWRPRIPTTLDECYRVLSKMDCTSFAALTEAELCRLHHNIGRELRNDWGLWKGENELCKYFHSLGVMHADDMSSIILTSFHRKLNGRPIDVEAQIEHYKNHWAALIPPNETIH